MKIQTRDSDDGDDMLRCLSSIFVFHHIIIIIIIISLCSISHSVGKVEERTFS